MNMHRIKSTLILLAFLLTPVAVASSVADAALFSGSKSEACKGARLDPAAPSDCGDTASGTLTGIIKSIINIISVIVGVAAVIMLIINGLRFITAGGDANSISSARSGVIYALIGLVIVAMAQIIVRFVLTRTPST